MITCSQLVQFGFVTSAAHPTRFQVLNNPRSFSTYYFRQAPSLPLSHYVEREAALASNQGFPYLDEVRGTALVTEAAIGVENAVSLQPAPTCGVLTGLIPITELVSSTSFSTSRSIGVQVVSVRRG